MARNPLRWNRLTTPEGNLLMVPMDHGISNGPVPGLIDPTQALQNVASHATCTTLHKGLIPLAAPYSAGIGILMHLSGSTDHGPDPNQKRLVGTVEEAIRLGCDGVSIHVNLGADTESDMLQDAGTIATACNTWNMPLIAMVYPRGPRIDNPFEPTLVTHAARLGAELGADAVKVPYTGNPDTFRDVVTGCPVPVIVAGGPRQDNFDDFLATLRDARDAGAAGVSIGRNVFQHPQPKNAMAAIAKLWP